MTQRLEIIIVRNIFIIIAVKILLIIGERRMEREISNEMIWLS